MIDIFLPNDKERAISRIFESCCGELSRRKCEAMYFVGQGHSLKIVAEKMFINEKSVKFHLTEIYRITGCKGKTQLALYVASIFSPPDFKKLSLEPTNENNKLPEGAQCQTQQQEQ